MLIFKSQLERSTQVRNDSGELYMQTYKPILLKSGYKMLVAKDINTNKYIHIIYMDDRGVIRLTRDEVKNNPIPQYRKNFIRGLIDCKL